MWGERRGCRVKRAHLVEALLYTTCLRIGGVGDELGELFVEDSGYFVVADEVFHVEGDGLVGRSLDTFAGEEFEKGKILGGVVLVRARLDCVYPLPFVGDADIFVYLVVERACV